MKPLVTIIMTTYEPGEGIRTQRAKQTIESLRSNLHYDNLAWIISDDGSHDTHIAHLSRALNGTEAIFLRHERRGVGYAKNAALKIAHEQSPLVLLTEDDWRLKQPLNLESYVNLLMGNEGIGMVRFGYLGGDMEATYESWKGVDYWRLKRNSGTYIYSGQVSLRHRRFYDIVGWHKEGVSPGEEELDMCFAFNHTAGAPDCIWPAEFATSMNKSAFENIGLDVSLNHLKPGE